MRDLTINSMFYNVNEGVVEDCLGMGYSDLMNGVIRTPVDALSTFTYDAVQLLRAIRFSSRFSFEIDPEILEAARDPRVQNCLNTKVTCERIGTELDKMFEGNNPEKSATLLHDLGLLKLIFKIPETALELQ